MSFFDLCTAPSSFSNSLLKDFAEHLETLGYAGFAVETIVSKPLNDIHKCKVPKLTGTDTKLIQLNRLTLDLQKLSLLNVRHSTQVTKTYDIVAAKVYTDKELRYLCKNDVVDIISFVPTGNAKMDKKLIDMAVKKGIQFELRFCDALDDTTEDQIIRQKWLAKASSLIWNTRGRNIIFTTGANHPLKLRSPDDLFAVARLVGLTDAQARLTMGETALKVIGHGEARSRMEKSAIIHSDIDNSEPLILMNGEQMCTTVDVPCKRGLCHKQKKYGMLSIPEKCEPVKFKEIIHLESVVEASQTEGEVLVEVEEAPSLSESFIAL